MRLAVERRQVRCDCITELDELLGTFVAGNQRAVLAKRFQPERAQPARYAAIDQLALGLGEIDAGHLLDDRAQQFVLVDINIVASSVLLSVQQEGGLVDAVESFEIPEGWRVWAAGEAAAMHLVRRHVFEERGMTRSQTTIRGYWKARR